ncbi:MAG: DUF6090 family protein [Flavobacteriaceae bacterium]|nr:DUF6090 family protein [Flavobacteriaceae bacterium]
MNRINWRYAFGEILIVIIGISIAFAINKYADNQQEKEQRLQYLSNIKQDLLLDKEVLEKNLDSIQNKIQLGQEIIPILNKDIPNKIQYAGKIFNYISLVEFIPNDITYNTLINSGDLNLIDDFELKKAIERHYSLYQTILKDYARIEEIRKNYIGDYFIRHLDYEQFSQGKFGFDNEHLLKNIIINMNGAQNLKLNATAEGIKSCESLLEKIESNL